MGQPSHSAQIENHPLRQEEAKAQVPVGLQRLTVSQSKPMLKMISRMMSRRLRAPGRKTTVDQDVHIKHKKVRYW